MVLHLSLAVQKGLKLRSENGKLLLVNNIRRGRLRRRLRDAYLDVTTTKSTRHVSVFGDDFSWSATGSCGSRGHKLCRWRDISISSLATEEQNSLVTSNITMTKYKNDGSLGHILGVQVQDGC